MVVTLKMNGKKNFGWKPTAAFNSIKHFEKHFTWKKCGVGKKISVFMPQN